MGRDLTVKPAKFFFIHLDNAKALAKNFGDSAQLIDKTLGFAVTCITITNLLLIAYGGNAVAIANMKKVIIVYAGGRTAISVIMFANAFFNFGDNAKDLITACDTNKKPDGTAFDPANPLNDAQKKALKKERAVRVVRGVTSTSQEALNMIRSGICSITMLVAVTAGAQISGTTAIVGMFPIATLAKHSIGLFEFTFDRATGAKKIVKKEEDPHPGTTALKGVASMGEVVLALAKVCGATLPMWPLIATMFAVSSIQMWEQLKKWDEKAEQARIDKNKAEDKGRLERVREREHHTMKVRARKAHRQFEALKQPEGLIQYQQDLELWKDQYFQSEGRQDLGEKVRTYEKAQNDAIEEMEEALGFIKLGAPALLVGA